MTMRQRNFGMVRKTFWSGIRRRYSILQTVSLITNISRVGILDLPLLPSLDTTSTGTIQVSDEKHVSPNEMETSTDAIDMPNWNIS
jgi:hypothetical protein